MFGAGFAKLFDLARVKKRHVMMASLVLGASGTSFVVGASGQRTNIKECGGCTFWLEGTPSVNATLSKTGSCAETCTKLDLGEKGIVNIANGTFDDLPNVEKLGLYPNAITSIPVDAFKFLPAVVVIDLDTNRLKRVPPDAFKYNTKLETIWLNNNDITMLPADIFQYNPKLQYLFLDGNNIANLPADIFKNNTELEWLEISGNPLGCVYGVPDSVYFLDSYGYDYGYEDEEKTPECPANCTVNTYYDADALVCFACPDGTFTDGVGAVNCTAGAVTSPVATTQTTTATPVTTPPPSPVFSSDTPVISSTPALTTQTTTATPVTTPTPSPVTPTPPPPAQTPAPPSRSKDWGKPEYDHCEQALSWQELIQGDKTGTVTFKMGGLGVLMEDEGYETWQCIRDHYCAADIENPWFCFVYHETQKVFTPWGHNSQLKLVSPAPCACKCACA